MTTITTSTTDTLEIRYDAGILSPIGDAAGVAVAKTSDGHQITIGKGCRAVLWERFEPGMQSSYTTQTKLQITLEEGAQLTHYKTVQEGAGATHQSFAEILVKRSAQFRSHVFLLDGAKVRNTIHVRLEGEGAECTLNGLYLGTGNQIVETHTLIDHVRPHGTSREFYKGILDGQAQGLFDGLVIVQKEAQKTDSSQTNKNLLLSPRARANSNPELKIFANDVKCKHGSTIGQISADHLFYLRSRGVPEPEARKLLIYAFASEMIEQVESQPLRDQLQTALFAKFHGRVL